jgi:Subtilisin-like serine proteases
MRHILILILLLSTGTIGLDAQTYMYRLELKDKGNSGYSIDNPLAFLSERSIERRTRQGLVIDETDLPISQEYIDALVEKGAKIRATSKWVSTISIEIEDKSLLSSILELPFVKNASLVWKGYRSSSASKSREENIERAITYNQSDYGLGYEQIAINSGQELHSLGFTGEGIWIAVMDGGFDQAYLMTDYFDWSKIIEVKNFTHEKPDPLDNYETHGTSVLSTMLADKKGVLVGTAPAAEYFLFQTENNNDEYPIEEDYWVYALEYADSLGVDIVSTSLGYYEFNDPSLNHTHADLDGYTVPASRAASMAVNKGMILSTAAGNEGNKAWKKISPPSDADHILAVGSVDAYGNISSFSSLGYSEDGRVKPDILGMGEWAWLATYPYSEPRPGNGTSFSCPLISGMTACLWQALPELTAFQIMDLIRSSSSHYYNPNEYYGYGIPDFALAYETGKEIVSIDQPVIEKNAIEIQIIDNHLFISPSGNKTESLSLRIYSASGLLVLQRNNEQMIDISSLERGVYIAQVRSNGQIATKKFIR